MGREGVGVIIRLGFGRERKKEERECKVVEMVKEEDEGFIFGDFKFVLYFYFFINGVFIFIF